jgi:hypothetical protein
VTKKRWDPSVKTERWDPRNEFDVVAFGTDGSVVWKDYGRPRRHIITRGNENPRDIAARDREKNEKREQEAAAKRERDEKRKGRTE